jgi:undecaprenyl-diphosphatase
MDFSFIQPFDLSFSLWLQSFQNPILMAPMIVITFFGNATFWFCIASLMVWAGRPKEAFHVMNLTVFSSAIVGALKGTFARPRPGLPIQQIFSDGFNTSSFPSGHSSLIGAMTAFFSNFYKTNFFRSGFVILAVLVALSRVYLGMHYLSDVIAGLILGIILGNIYYEAMNKYKKTFQLNTKKDQTGIVLILLLTVIAVLFIEQIGIIAAVLGFYAGLFLYDESHENMKKLKGIELVKVWIGGAVGWAVILAANISMTGSWEGFGILSFILYFIAGFWATYGYPKVLQYITGSKSK